MKPKIAKQSRFFLFYFWTKNLISLSLSIVTLCIRAHQKSAPPEKRGDRSGPPHNESVFALPQEQQWNQVFVTFFGTSEAIVQQLSFALIVRVTCCCFSIGGVYVLLIGLSILVSNFSRDHQRCAQIRSREGYVPWLDDIGVAHITILTIGLRPIDSLVETLSPGLYPPLTDTDESNLLRRFSSEVVPSVVGRSYSLIWKSTVHSIQPAPPYVVHCMFSVSAIYHAETANLSELQVNHHRNLGIHHENLALSLLRPELNCINADNCEAIYASTALIFLSTIALPRFNKKASDSFLERLVELSELAKGPLAVRRSSPKPLHSLYNLKPWNEPIDLPAELTDPLDNIRRVVEADNNNSDANATRKSIYLQAINTLKQTLIAMFHNKLYPLIIFMFLSVVDRQFIQLVASKDVMALRILGHYGVCSSYIPRKWWNRYWGRDIIDAVMRILDEEDAHRHLPDDQSKYEQSKVYAPACPAHVNGPASRRQREDEFWHHAVRTSLIMKKTRANNRLQRTDETEGLAKAKASHHVASRLAVEQRAHTQNFHHRAWVICPGWRT
ncbi:conserved hypothetical protein [Paecilomyces variotii No. 5]|uniref:Uncharacterized protein n=1 Tax=Byssochlamys spectabilis (strain No. 5 / NBRC 109023) TaxID=1356009 RepID=V5HZG8_BYSSN|nr:conserved hypothetical protein [Paecilomyces variotii No. 5]